MEYYQEFLINEKNEDIFKDSKILKSGKLEIVWNPDTSGWNLSANGIIIENNNRALYGDTVYYGNDYEKVSIIGIKERTKSLIPGILQLQCNQKYGFNKRKVPYYRFETLDPRYPTFIVPSKHRGRKNMLCVIEFNRWTIGDKHPIGQMYKDIGQVGNMYNDITSLLYKHDIYPKKNNFKLEFEKCSFKSNTVNTVNTVNTFSIDPPNCIDIDDALSVEVDGSDPSIVTIGIHIANVGGEYLKGKNSNQISVGQSQTIYTKYLDKHNSLESQMNMLENGLTENVYSLGNNSDSRDPKNALSLIITVNSKLDKILKTEFKECKVVNRALNYKQVQNLIDKSTSIDEKLDTKIHFAYNFFKRNQDNTHQSIEKMIEFYMVYYNKTVAETLYNINTNTILRTHLESATKNETIFNDPTNSRNDESLKKHLAKCSLNAALYEIKPTNTSHSALNLEYYTHATSPIRRFVDIVNQINILYKINNINQFLIPNQNLIDKINRFDKNLKRFYNINKKLDFIYDSPANQLDNIDAYIINISGIRVKIYIPSLNIEHSIYIISPKMVTDKSQNKIEYNHLGKKVTINGYTFELHQKIVINIAKLTSMSRLNSKLFITIIEPEITLL